MTPDADRTVSLPHAADHSASGFAGGHRMFTNETGATLIRRMRVARGDAAADLAVRGGSVLNVFTGELEEVDVLVADGCVAALVPTGTPAVATVEIDATGMTITPGLIDAHFHMGGTHLSPAALAAGLLARGTTAIATDCYEIYTTAGPEGVRYALDELARAGMHVLFLPPAHLIGLEQVGTFGWDVSAKDMADMLDWPETVGVMEPPASAVLTEHAELLNLLALVRAKRLVFAGHAPGESGRQLQAYIGTGASSDHESKSVPEAAEKLRYGMAAMMREGSASPDLNKLLGLVERYPNSSRYFMMCSDETDPSDLATKGHMDLKIRIAMDFGIPAALAIQMATVNIAEHFRVGDRIGSVAPGRAANLVLVRQLADFTPSTVISGGVVVSHDGESVFPIAPRPAPSGLKSVARRPRAFEPDDFRMAAPEPTATAVTIRTIGVTDATLVSRAGTRSARVRNGRVQPDPGSDLLSIAVAERHRGSGRVGLGFVEGFGFENAAVAMTYCHVFHNILVVGSSPQLMADAANELAEIGGGVVVLDSAGELTRWPLDLAGVLDDRPSDQVRASFEQINARIRGIGCALSSPVLSMSFIALPTIPAYGLTDRGLFDVVEQKFVDVIVPAQSK